MQGRLSPSASKLLMEAGTPQIVEKCNGRSLSTVVHMVVMVWELFVNESLCLPSGTLLMMHF